MKIKEIVARKIPDSRKEDTIDVSVKTNYGRFSASAPSGKSKGKNETPAFVKNINDSIKKVTELNDKIKSMNFEQFSDLGELEKIADKKFIGANTLFALETAILKALAVEQKKELWQIINDKAKRFPCPVGNCIGGGLHSDLKVKPDFQEFLVIPRARNFADNVFIMGEAHRILGEKLEARKNRFGFSDENGWKTSLNNEAVIDMLDSTRNELEESSEERVDIGVDAASSSFSSGKNYIYKNPLKVLEKNEQIDYIADLVENYKIGYIEDPLYEEDFEGFADLRRKIIDMIPALVVGDDLIASQVDRLKQSLVKRSVNSIIVKPNQTGSLLEIKKLVELAKKYEIVTIMSHRSGETMDYALADLAFGFQTEFIKTGVIGKEREVKLKRMIAIEQNLLK